MIVCCLKKEIVALRLGENFYTVKAWKFQSKTMCEGGSGVERVERFEDEEIRKKM